MESGEGGWPGPSCPQEQALEGCVDKCAELGDSGSPGWVSSGLRCCVTFNYSLSLSGLLVESSVKWFEEEEVGLRCFLEFPSPYLLHLDFSRYSGTDSHLSIPWGFPGHLAVRKSQRWA